MSIKCERRMKGGVGLWAKRAIGVVKRDIRCLIRAIHPIKRAIRGRKRVTRYSIRVIHSSKRDIRGQKRVTRPRISLNQTLFDNF